MTEDDLYRTTTQYRLWSYTPEALAALRAKTNTLAVERVLSAVRRSRSQHEQNEAPDTAPAIDCLTVDEEQKLVDFYCVKAMELADFCEFPTNIKATAVQYIKRFYLTNSPMTYHPKELMVSAVFLATKTDNHYISLRNFAAKLPMTSEEAIIAPEFLLTQGLQFTFDVRHPFRGLDAGLMELNAIAAGAYQPPPSISTSAVELQRQLLELPTVSGAPSRGAASAMATQTRIKVAYTKAKDLLKTSALRSDAYFLYPPAQIWLAALLIVDRPLGLLFLVAKRDAQSSAFEAVLARLQSCATLLAAVGAGAGAAASEAVVEERRELTRIDKKLYRCRNPESGDQVGSHRAPKREDEEDEAKAAKKRRVERENGMAAVEDVFGPALEKSTG